MKGDDKVRFFHHLHGPWLWALSSLLGVALGAVLTLVLVPEYSQPGSESGTITHAPIGVITPFHVIPFALLLLCIALMPFINARAWHRHFPDFAFGLAGLVVGYYLSGFSRPDYQHGLSYGQSTLLHAAIEYYSFIALVGGLYVVSGGILVELRGRGTPLINTLVLAFGAVIANLVGTTGASMLLIRPFLRLNVGRTHPLHVVLFIFIVSNCGGCLTPIGDPPLYLGYLKGLPFSWTTLNMWQDWLVVVPLLLGIFFVIDTLLSAKARRAAVKPHPHTHPIHVPDLLADEAPPAPRGFWPSLSVTGAAGISCLGLMILGVFIDPLLKHLAGIEGLPIGATFQIAVAICAYRMTPKRVLEANEFSFFPVKEVGLLFIGIFITMVPALGYLSSHGDQLGLASATSYYFGTGALSAVLDNAPTYLNFLQLAVAPDEITGTSLEQLTSTPGGRDALVAISTSAVFFGAMTYIGNGPNFMVRSIAEAAEIKMPSFFGYLGWACIILLPVLALHWLILIR